MSLDAREMRRRARDASRPGLTEFELLRKIRQAQDAMTRAASLRALSTTDPETAIRERLADDQAVLDDITEHLLNGGDRGFDTYDLPRPVRSHLFRFALGPRPQQDIDRVHAVLDLHHRDGMRCAADLRPWPCPTLYALAHDEEPMP